MKLEPAFQIFSIAIIEKLFPWAIQYIHVKHLVLAKPFRGLAPDGFRATP